MGVWLGCKLARRKPSVAQWESLGVNSSVCLYESSMYRRRWESVEAPESTSQALTFGADLAGDLAVGAPGTVRGAAAFPALRCMSATSSSVCDYT